MSHGVRRVLLLTKGLDVGGLERVVVDLAGALSRAGVQVDVAVVNNERDALAGELDDQGVPVRRLGGSDAIGVRTAPILSRLVTRGAYDVVHAHGPLTAVLARLTVRGSPVVSTAHTMWAALRPATRSLWVTTAPLDAATLAVSGAVAESLPRSVRPGVLVIPHGVDISAVRSSASGATRYDPSHPVTAITVASHRHAKDYPTLLKALRIALNSGADLRIVAIGEGPDLHRHRALAHEIGISDAVEFRPPTPHVLTDIAAGDFLVVASGVEGQPLVVVEALALGRPVVSTAVGRVPELVSPSVGRVVPPGDPHALGAALVEVASDPSLRARMGQAARQVPAWSLDRVAEEHLTVYARVARG